MLLNTPRSGRIYFEAIADGTELVFRVRDNGMGIDNEELHQLFEPFYQVKTPSESPNSGLGIGLTLVKKIVDMHGGYVEVFSDGPGKGSEFIVRLPGVIKTDAAESSSSTLNGEAAWNPRNARYWWWTIIATPPMYSPCS